MCLLPAACLTCCSKAVVLQSNSVAIACWQWAQLGFGMVALLTELPCRFVQCFSAGVKNSMVHKTPEEHVCGCCEHSKDAANMLHLEDKVAYTQTQQPQHCTLTAMLPSLLLAMQSKTCQPATITFTNCITITKYHIFFFRTPHTAM